MNLRKLAIGTAIALTAFYLLGAPYLTVYRMKSAAERGDAAALTPHIDFASVRRSLKEQLNVELADQIAQNTEADSPFGALGTVIGGVVVDRVVESYVTPAGVTQLMSGAKPTLRKRNPSDERRARKPLNDATLSYESWSTFTVTMPRDDGKSTRFILSRRGLGWQLTDIVLPLGASDTPAQ